MTSTHTIIRALRQSAGAALLGLLLPVLSAPTVAETVAIPLGQQSKAWNVETPKTGFTKDQVEARFGEPQQRTGPVGDPPIYTWDYGHFKVYFEADRVIHSVVKHQPQQQ